MLNYQLPLLALLAANRFGDSSSDTARAALLAMTIRPPMAGLLVALVVAKRKAPTKVVASNPSASGGPRPGTIVNSLIPRVDRSFFPSFIDLSERQASHLATELGLKPIFVDPAELAARGREVVVRQEPKEGTDWPRDLDAVRLYLG